MGTPLIRDTDGRGAARLRATSSRTTGRAALWQAQPVGTVDEVVAYLCAVRASRAIATSSFGFPSPYDDETMTRLATEVRPRLEALVKRLQEGAPDA